MLSSRALLIKAGYQVLLKEPVEYHFGGSQFFRDDYAVETNGVQMGHAQFATVENAYALVFIFLGQDQASVDEMTKSMDTFERALPVRRGVRTVVGSAPQHKPTKRKP